MYILDKNYLGMKASVGFPEEITIELKSKIQLDED